MFRFSESFLLVCLIAVYQLTSLATAAAQSPASLVKNPAAVPNPESAQVSAEPVDAQLVDGLPGMKPKEKGKLEITHRSLLFRGKSGSVELPIASILAVGTDNQRVELWGVKGRILRMVIPNGGGLLAATMLHHRVDTLSVEFEDERGGYHAAVFYVDAQTAQRVLQLLSSEPPSGRTRSANTCDGGHPRPRTVRVLQPEWSNIEVPPAYRALLYESLVERLQKTKGVDYVYRDGEADAQQACAAFTVALTASEYKKGSQVQRASTGPVGFFLGTTRLKFDMQITDAAGGLNYRAEIGAAARGETESMKVADAAAKKVAKEFTKAEKQAQKPVVLRAAH